MRTKTFILQCLAMIAVSIPSLAADKNSPVAADGDLITLTGAVKSASDRQFVMNYGASGQVTVNLGDWNWYDTDNLRPGEIVTVTGVVDDNFFKGREINAGRVFVHDRNTYYYGREAGADQKNYYYSYYYERLSAGKDWIGMSGTVGNVEAGAFDLDAGRTIVRVDTSQMQDNPLDNKGPQKIKSGDVVQVFGVLNDSLFTDRELAARTIVTLYRP
jgi:uncharacterized protein YdeI (BOF family)